MLTTKTTTTTYFKRREEKKEGFIYYNDTILLSNAISIVNQKNTFNLHVKNKQSIRLIKNDYIIFPLHIILLSMTFFIFFLALHDLMIVGYHLYRYISCPSISISALLMSLCSVDSDLVDFQLQKHFKIFRTIIE